MSDKYTLTVKCGTAQEMMDVINAPRAAAELRRIRDKILAFKQAERATEVDIERMVDAILDILKEMKEI